jgi:hypothetical protein
MHYVFLQVGWEGVNSSGMFECAINNKRLNGCYAIYYIQRENNKP